MKIDLHIHSKNGSDGKWDLKEIFAEAAKRDISFLSITDHDSLQGQGEAIRLAKKYGMKYITGIEMNITLTHPVYTRGKATSLDFLGYGFNIANEPLNQKLKTLRDYREKRAEQILENINREFRKEGIPGLTHEDMKAIQESVDGSFGRPHIANYLIKKGIVTSKQEAFDRYLVRCDVPKMPLSLEEASMLVRGAGGKLVLAHPNDTNGTSLAVLAKSPAEQQEIIREVMIPLIDGIECWHTTHDTLTSSSYLEFVLDQGLIATGGSDCHQQPVIMGGVAVPDCVAGQFGV
jgi:predicted metal-dependent phosphoesterase TrpH